MPVLLCLLLLLPYVLAGCAEQPPRGPAVPVATYTGETSPPVWSKPLAGACVFPPEADVAKIDGAEVILRVLVRADGSAELVQTIAEPGVGFGRAATRCAMTRRYVPAKDVRGVAVRGWTPPFRVRFIR
ncbi:MAG TPA: energy transducer TonB [Polyangiaceae bacterium]|nr:energy transducer TonB [Polyangiaceae bacterium]